MVTPKIPVSVTTNTGKVQKSWRMPGFLSQQPQLEIVLRCPGKYPVVSLFRNLKPVSFSSEIYTGFTLNRFGSLVASPCHWKSGCKNVRWTWYDTFINVNIIRTYGRIFGLLSAKCSHASLWLCGQTKQRVQLWVCVRICWFDSAPLYDWCIHYTIHENIPAVVSLCYIISWPHRVVFLTVTSGLNLQTESVWSTEWLMLPSYLSVRSGRL